MRIRPELLGIAVSAALAAAAPGGGVAAAKTVSATLVQPVEVVAQPAPGVSAIEVSAGTGGFPIAVTATGSTGSAGAVPAGYYVEVEAVTSTGQVFSAAGRANSAGAFSFVNTLGSGYTDYEILWSATPFQNQITNAGSMFPAGTTAASANPIYQPPSGAIDGQLSTEWSSSQDTATLTITLGSPEYLSSVGIVPNIAPPQTAQYEIYGQPSGSGSWQLIGSASEYVQYAFTGSYYNFFSVPVTPGTYQALQVYVNAGSSWVGVNEVTANPPTSGYPSTVPSNGVI